MNKIKPLFGSTLAAFSLAFCFSQTAAAGVTQVWAVSSTSKVNCVSSQHGLWTNNLYSGGCNNYFDFNASSTLTEYEEGFAVLDATATNPGGKEAIIKLVFGGYTDTHSPVKTGGGGDPLTWDFYTTIKKGGIKINDKIFTDFSMVGGYALQIGEGANDKTGVFGASVWLKPAFYHYDGPMMTAQYENYKYGGGHWDLNMELKAVPVPAAVWLFGSGLIGLVAVARRKLQA